MPVKTYCYVPDVLLDPSQETAHQVRRILREAIAANLRPDGFPRDTKPVAVLLDDDILENLKALANPSGQVLGRLVGGLLYAHHLAGRPTSGSSGQLPHIQGVHPVLDGLRPGQSRVLQECVPLLKQGKLVFSECGTGSGKARLIAHTAAWLLSARDAGQTFDLPTEELCLKSSNPLPQYVKRTIVLARAIHQGRLQRVDENRKAAVIACAPSVENVAHLAKEWKAVQGILDPQGVWKVATRLGRGQFINPSALEVLLQDSEHDHPNVRDWLDAKMPAGRTRSTRALLDVDPALSALLGDLEHITMSDEHPIDFKACVLDEDSDPEDQKAYTEHCARVRKDADLIFTTTALVCLDTLSMTQDKRPPLLPVNTLGLLIDEAHDLESTQAHLAAKTFSITRVRAELGVLRGHGKTQVSKALELLKELQELLSEFPNETRVPPVNLDSKRGQDWLEAKNLILRINQLIKSLTGLYERYSNKSPKEAKALRSLSFTRRDMDYVLQDAGVPMQGVVTHSPVRGMISLSFGPKSVERHLRARWSVTPCAMLLSGSLFFITENGGYGGQAAAELGATSRFAQTTELHPTWLFTTPTLHMPGPRNFHRFIPPTKKEMPTKELTEIAMTHWLDNCAQVIARVAQSAKGGTLVLMTGYERLEILAKRLPLAMPEIEHGRILVQTRTAGTSVMAEEFLSLSNQGLRPIWLATGPASTGLDLADPRISSDLSDAHKDMILTDLVIPALPFGLEHSSTQTARRRAIGFAAVIVVAQRKFRQQIGRLVRREGVMHRHLWILDGRLINPVSLQYTADLRRVLNRYLKREVIE